MGDLHDYDVHFEEFAADSDEQMVRIVRELNDSHITDVDGSRTLTGDALVWRVMFALLGLLSRKRHGDSFDTQRGQTLFDDAGGR